MPFGLTDPLITLSFSAMSLDQLHEHHLDLVARKREVDHWRRLIAARIDLAVAAVTGIDEPDGDGSGRAMSLPAPPAGLRDLVGIAPQEHRLGETGLLLELRRVLHDLECYGELLTDVAADAARVIAVRSGLVPVSA